MRHVRGILVRGSVAIALALLIAMPPAQARPRLGPAGILLAPLAIIGGIAGAAAGSRKARAHRSQKARPSARRDRGVVRRGQEAAPRTEQAAVKDASAKETAANDNGWAGPLFWPHAYDGVFEYTFALPGDDGEFWSRGFGDVIDGMFRLERASYAPRRSSDERSWDEMCGSQAQKPAEAIVARLREIVQPTPAQNEALLELRAALTRATTLIEAACPDSRAATPPDRLRMMVTRLRGMSHGLLAVQGTLRDFYNSLDPSQRSALDRAGEAGDARADRQAAAGCGAPVANWPQEQIERALQPTKAQRAQLEELRRRSLGLAQFVASTCPRETPATMFERLEAVKDRLAVLRYAASNVSPAFERFYGSLSNTQKSRFRALGRERSAARDD